MTDRRLCFVIGPIGAHKSDDRFHADRLLKLIIKPTFSVNFKDYKVERADEISKPGMIDSQVISHLIEADLVVADLTTRNANAFYELGIRHLIQKPVIHVYRRGEPIPADIQPYRAIEFEYKDKDDIREAKSALRKAVNEIHNPNYYLENPVTRSRAMIKFIADKKRANEDLLQLAVTSHTPVAQLRASLSAWLTKKNLTFQEGGIKPYYDLAVEADSRANKLFEAIRDLPDLPFSSEIKRSDN
jgi:hypothetical protein